MRDGIASGTLKSNSIAAVAFGALAAVLIGLAALSYAARLANERAASTEQNRVIEAIRQQRQTTFDDTVAASAHATPSVAGLAHQNIGSLGQFLVLDQTGALLRLAGSGPDTGDLEPEIAPIARQAASGPSPNAGAMISVEGDLFDVVALARPDIGVAATDGMARPVAVGVRRVGAEYLSRIAAVAGVRDLELVRSADQTSTRDGAAITRDWGDFRLRWRPRRPGDRLVMQWSVAIVVLAALLAAFIIWRARRLADDLAAREARAVKASTCDWLSGLPNRIYFGHALEHELEALKQKGGKLALFHLDLDRFKDLNDAYGIEVGDGLIQAMTQRIAKVVRQGDLIARFEGDAFMILQLGVESTRDCEALAQHIYDAMKEAFDIAGHEIAVSVSIGIALAPDDASERTELVKLANLALHRAKREGRGRLAFYRPAMEEEWRRRIAAELDLKQAIENEGLVLRYQPIVDSRTGEVVCVEALVRWQHPVAGLIAPDSFIGFAEERGLILPLGQWVLREACNTARRWGGIRVAVNVSPIQFRHPDFVATVARLLDETGLEPSLLELELTEGVLIESAAEAAIAITELRRKGVRLVLDDFGTGYSSLIYLRRFTFDKIKIDRAFIEALDPEGESFILVDSVIKLGRALGLMVTAEGIETAEQRDLLTALGCDELQGYLFARPLTLEALDAVLEAAPFEQHEPIEAALPSPARRIAGR